MVAAVGGTWRAELAERPPRELPGCAGCPGRCAALTAVAGLPAPTLTAVAARAGATTSPPAVVRSLGSLPDAALGAALAATPNEAARRRLLYCAVVVATTGDAPASLLDHLREGVS